MDRYSFKVRFFQNYFAVIAFTLALLSLGVPKFAGSHRLCKIVHPAGWHRAWLWPLATTRFISLALPHPKVDTSQPCQGCLDLRPTKCSVR